MRGLRILLWAMVLPALMLGAPRFAVAQTAASNVPGSVQFEAASAPLSPCSGSHFFLARPSVRHSLLHQAAILSAVPHQRNRHASPAIPSTRFAPVLVSVAIDGGANQFSARTSSRCPFGRSPPLA